MKKKLLYLFLVFVSMFFASSVSADDKLFDCEYNVKITDTESFPLTVSVYKDKTAKFINAGHDMEDGYNNKLYIDKENTYGATAITIAVNDFVKRATADDKASCPDLSLDIHDATSFTLYNENNGNTTGMVVTTGPTPKTSGNTTPPNVLKITKSCPNFSFKGEDIPGVDLDFNLTLNMYSDGSKKMCMSMDGYDDACSKVTDEGGYVLFSKGNQNYNFKIKSDQVSKIFSQNFDGKKCSSDSNLTYSQCLKKIDNSKTSSATEQRKNCERDCLGEVLIDKSISNMFICPSNIYVCEEAGIAEGQYTFTTDKNEAKKCGYNSQLEPDPKNTEEEKDKYKAVCGVLTENAQKFIYNILDWIKYIALVLAIGLSVLDFFKAVASEEDDAFTKAAKKFGKRLIVVVILFLLPVILEFVLKLVHIQGVDSSNPMCK